MRISGTFILSVGLAAWLLQPSVVLAVESSQSVHVVKAGQTLATIARDCLGDESRWQEISRLNGLHPPYKISVGQKLSLPQPAAQTQTPVGTQGESISVTSSSRTASGASSAGKILTVGGIGVFVLGCIIGLVGFFLFTVAAFCEGFWWGIGTLLIQPIQIVFLVKFWDKAKGGFITQCVGIAMIVIGLATGCLSSLSDLK